MLRHVEFRNLSAVLAVVLSTATAYGQSAEVQPANMETEVAGIKAENAALREQLRRVEEQQKILLDVVNDLKQRLGLARRLTCKERSWWGNPCHRSGKGSYRSLCATA